MAKVIELPLGTGFQAVDAGPNAKLADDAKAGIPHIERVKNEAGTTLGTEVKTAVVGGVASAIRWRLGPELRERGFAADATVLPAGVREHSWA